MSTIHLPKDELQIETHPKEETGDEENEQSCGIA
jgi:hypothetical protein